MGRFVKITLAAALGLFGLVPGIAAAKPGDLLVGDNNGDVVRVNARTGVQTTVATSPAMNDASGIAFTRSGKLLVADYNAGPAGSGLVFRVDPRTGSVAPVPGTTLAQPVHLELLASGALYVPDLDSVPSRVFKVDLATGATAPLSGPVAGAYAIDQLPNATLVVSALDTPAILRMSPTTGALSTIASGLPLEEPVDLDVAPNGLIYVADGSAGAANKGALIEINPRTGAQRIVADGGFFDDSIAVGIAPNGKAYIANSGQPNEVYSVDLRSGAQALVSPGGGLIEAPEGLEVEPPRCAGKVATIVGSNKADRIKASPYPDVIAGLGGRDRIRGLKGADRICGGKGRDRLIGGKGRDKLRGGPGRDFQVQ
jgi:Ca2+-binding RTX toxin-like protein